MQPINEQDSSEFRCRRQGFVSTDFQFEHGGRKNKTQYIYPSEYHPNCASNTGKCCGSDSSKYNYYTDENQHLFDHFGDILYQRSCLEHNRTKKRSIQYKKLFPYIRQKCFSINSSSITLRKEI